MCKSAPGKRCSSHVLEGIRSLEKKISTLDESVAHKNAVIAARRRKDSNFDETVEGQQMVASLDEDYLSAAELRERLHQEKASFYLTEAGKKHLQEIIDDPASSANEILEAQIHHRTALTREEKDKEVMKIVKDEDLDLTDKEELLKAKLGNTDDEIARIGDRLKDINENYETVQAKIERFRIRGEHDKVKEWTKVSRRMAEEGRYLTSYKSQLKSHKTNVERYLNRKQDEAEKAARNAERAAQIKQDQKRAKRQSRGQKIDRFFDKMVKRIIMDWL